MLIDCDKAFNHIKLLKAHFNNTVNPLLIRAISYLSAYKYEGVTIPDDDFIIDEMSVFNNLRLEQLSFHDIMKEKTITPVVRRNPASFTFNDVCPFCGDPHKYIYKTKGKCNLIRCL